MKNSYDFGKNAKNKNTMTDKYLNFDEYIRQGELITGGNGLKGQSANSPRQRIGNATVADG